MKAENKSSLITKSVAINAMAASLKVQSGFWTSWTNQCHPQNVRLMNKILGSADAKPMGT